MDKPFKSYSIDDRSFVAFAKRDIHSDLLQSHFSKNKIAEIDIIVAELTSNLIKHAKRGLLLCRLENLSDDQSVIELIVIDNGPGIADVAKMMRDGTSTAKTLGHGLGAIGRLSSQFQVFSIPKWGTICYSLVRSGIARKVNTIDLETRWLSIAKDKEVFCGDGHAVVRTKGQVKVLVGDGLGHGPFAHEAATQAIDAFRASAEEDPVSILRDIHQQVRKTRGLVATVAVLDFKERKWRICGVGNILARLYGGIMFKHYTAYNGIVGLNIPNSMKETIIDAEKNQQLIMCSDGLRSRWDLTKYPSILKYDNMVLAAALLKDFNRATDDSSVFIGKVVFEK